MASKPCVVFVPTPGMGHFIPHVELAKKLVFNHGLSATFIIPSMGPPPKAQMEILESFPEGINYVILPPVRFSDLPDNSRAETRFILTVSLSVSSIRDEVSSLVGSTRLIALVVDLFGTDVFEVAVEFKMQKYIFFPCSAMSLSSLFYFEKLHKVVSCEYRDMPKPFQIPGSRVLVNGRDLPDPVQDKKNDAYKWFLHNAERHYLSDGILLNSFADLEPETVQVLQKREYGQPPVYAIAPILYSGSRAGLDESECLKWLDDQPRCSVLFVSFGSGGTLSLEQLNELAMGLELSGHKFLWAIKSPDKTANASFFNAQSNKDPFDYLPGGFLDRIKGRGLLVSSWAPQVQVLSHSATGGFLSHCGWNSTLEGIAHGVPFIAWPLYAEQKMNAVLITEDLQVGLRPKVNENGLVGREEIARLVKALMQNEGEASNIPQRINTLKEAAARAVSNDGASTKSLKEVVDLWKNKPN
ncbi:hypothetical protein K2173_003367 [Erythroxylum novogranatense]|uniref:Glycosyltransferase n=1 Tax=Erythroxylum novogranatense TaxID=1862640 RepID=A0AAV8S8U4_9ROSI|nr:hypothetical protein K2173_003367 [Erythroxylum novogranatense]